MKSRIALLCFCLCTSAFIQAQTTDAKAAASAKRDSMLLKKLNDKGTYPLVKGNQFCGVMPVDGITEKPGANMKYKLLFNFTAGTNDSIKVKSANRGLAEIGRI